MYGGNFDRPYLDLLVYSWIEVLFILMIHFIIMLFVLSVKIKGFAYEYRFTIQNIIGLL